MELKIEFLIYLVLGFALALALTPFVFWLAKKIRAQQKILHYVKEHKQKEGTPTFGGLIFIFALVLLAFSILKEDSTLAILTIASTLSFGLLGFLDDFIKIKFKQNQGLKAYQKLVGQLGIGGILSYFVYSYVGTSLYLPFTFTFIDLGFWVVPLTFFVFIALLNSVNLIDGLDGLSAGVSLFYLVGLVSFVIIFASDFFVNGDMQAEVDSLLSISFIFIGALIAYLMVNIFPAKIFMGDTGSLAMGGFLTAVTVFLRMTLLIPIIGIMFVLTALSDVLQVGYFKWKRKRIFKMAPLHHHFQMSGVHENRIVFYYVVITLFASLVNIILTSVANGG